MCGIFGVVSEEQDASLPDFLMLGQRNTERGNLGFGGVSAGSQNETVYRYAEPFSPAKVPMQPAPVRLGHVRAPTGGQSSRGIHPFETADFLLAHNGLLLNHTDHPSWRLDPSLAVDSQVILGGIQAATDGGADVVSAVRMTVEQLEGQQACWLWDRRARMLYLWRVMAPIYTGTIQNQVLFSSIRTDSVSTLLDEGVIYQYRPVGFAALGSFRFYNPYKS